MSKTYASRTYNDAILTSILLNNTKLNDDIKSVSNMILTAALELCENEYHENSYHFREMCEWLVKTLSFTATDLGTRLVSTLSDTWQTNCSSRGPL